MPCCLGVAAGATPPADEAVEEPHALCPECGRDAPCAATPAKMGSCAFSIADVATYLDPADESIVSPAMIPESTMCKPAARCFDVVKADSGTSRRGFCPHMLWLSETSLTHRPRI